MADVLRGRSTHGGSLAMMSLVAPTRLRFETKKHRVGWSLRVYEWDDQTNRWVWQPEAINAWTDERAVRAARRRWSRILGSEDALDDALYAGLDAERSEAFRCDS